MFHDNNNDKTSEKFSFFYNNDNDAYWKLTNNTIGHKYFD